MFVIIFLKLSAGKECEQLTSPTYLLLIVRPVVNCALSYFAQEGRLDITDELTADVLRFNEGIVTELSVTKAIPVCCPILV